MVRLIGDLWVAREDDRTLEDGGQLVVRESLNPTTQDLVILKSVLPDQFRRALAIPAFLAGYKVRVNRRTYEQSAMQLRQPGAKVDYVRVCGGVANLMSLFTQENSKDHAFLLMRETEDAKLVLEKLLVGQQGMRVVERVLLRLVNSLMTPSTQDIQPADLKIVKEVYSEGKRQICTVKLSHKTKSVWK